MTADEAGTRLDQFLRASDRLASHGRARWALERGKILLNDADAGPDQAGFQLRAGDRVALWLDRPGSARTRLRSSRPADEGTLVVVYEDDSVIAVNKPAGLLTVPLARRAGAGSVEGELVKHLRRRGKQQPLVVHRIDRDTSGLVLFARHPAAQQALKAQFERRTPERVYLAVVAGVPEPPVGRWVDWVSWDDDALVQAAADPYDRGANEVRSEYRVAEAWPAIPAALLEVRLVTGKRNQIRYQAQRHGHPLVGERMYAGPRAAADEPEDFLRFGRQALHAWRLVVEHPDSGRRLMLEAPLPADLQELVRRLRRSAKEVERADPRKKFAQRGPSSDVRRPKGGKE